MMRLNSRHVLRALVLLACAASAFSTRPACGQNLNVDGGNVIQSDGSFRIFSAAYVGRYSSASSSYTISNGSDTFIQTQSWLGYTPPAQGTITVTGAGSTFQTGNYQGSSGYNYVGYQGQGTINVQAAGTVFANYNFVGYFQGSMGTVNVTGANSRLQTAYATDVGLDGQGTLNVQSGGLSSALYHYLGDSQLGVGTATVTGTGSTLQSSSITYVGSAGRGMLNVENGGLSTAGFHHVGYWQTGTGSATVTGADSRLESSSNTYVGLNGHGTLNVQNGGLAAAQNQILGLNSTGVGTATVTGANSRLQSSASSYVGDTGQGTLNLQDGGLASARDHYVGYSSSGTGTVSISGQGSALQSSGTTVVGYSGRGTLNLDNGGHSTAGYHYLGYQQGSTGSAVVAGQGSQLESTGYTYVGAFGRGTLDVRDGGTASASITYVGYGNTSTGSVSITGDGSRMTTRYLFVGGWDNAPGGASTVSVGNGGILEVDNNTIVWGPGALRIDNGGTLVNNGGFYTQGGVLVLQPGGTIAGSGTFYTPVALANGATVAPGNSPGTMSFNAGLTFGPGGFYDWQILDPDAGAGIGWDQILVNGSPLNITATSANPFTINLISLSDASSMGPLAGFDSSQDYSWRILGANSILGFDSGAFLLNWSAFQNSLAGGQFSLSRVDNSLYLDFTAAAVNSVPEPSSLALIFCGGLTGLVSFGRRRWRSKHAGHPTAA